MTRRRAVLGAVCIFLLVVGVLGVRRIQDARLSAIKVVSQNTVKQLITEVVTHTVRHGQFPDSLDSIRGTKNPVTGDSPGYEYVKPTARPFEPGHDQLILIYQLRNGERAMDLAVGYADGSSREIGPSKW